MLLGSQNVFVVGSVEQIPDQTHRCDLVNTLPADVFMDPKHSNLIFNSDRKVSELKIPSPLKEPTFSLSGMNAISIVKSYLFNH